MGRLPERKDRMRRSGRRNESSLRRSWFRLRTEASGARRGDCASTRLSGFAGSRSPGSRRRSWSAVFGFGLKFPVLACFALVAASAALNLALRWRFPVSTQLERARRGDPARLRHPSALGSSLPHRRRRQSLRHPAPRAGHDRGDVAVAAQRARPARPRPRLRDGLAASEPAAALDRRRKPEPAADLCPGGWVGARQSARHS